MKTCDNLVATINGKTVDGIVTLEYQMKVVDKMNNVEKKLGKIKSAYFGFEKNGGKRIGLFMELYCESGILSSCSRFWDSIKIKPKFGYDWDEDTRDKRYSEIVRRVSLLLNEANVDRVEKLVGIPVELTIADGNIKSWRILTEVL